MAKEKLNLYIDSDLKRRWERVAKKFGWSKSAMLEDMLLEVLPYLEEAEPKNIIANSLKSMAKKLEELGEIVNTKE